VPVFAVRLRRVLGGEADTTKEIGATVHRFKVAGAYAVVRPAEVVEMQPLGYGSPHDLVGDSVGHHPPLCDTEGAVSVGASVAVPQPTRGWGRLTFGQDAKHANDASRSVGTSHGVQYNRPTLPVAVTL
jgi:hypothetical protein